MINDKRVIYLLLNDEGEGTVIDDGNGNTPNNDDDGESKKPSQNNEPKVDDKNKTTTKKSTKPKEKNVTISQKEFKEYNDLKRANMSAEEREKALLQDIENLNLKIETYESTIEEQTKEINTMKAQEGIKNKISEIEEKKPYLKKTLDKRKEKGFNSIDELDEFIKFVDDETLKEAYETNKNIRKATKITGSTRTNIPVNHKVNQTNYDDVDLSKYGL